MATLSHTCFISGALVICGIVVMSCGMNDSKIEEGLNQGDDAKKNAEVEFRSTYDSTEIFYSRKNLDESIKMTLAWKNNTVFVLSKEIVQAQSNHVTSIVSHSDWTFDDDDAKLNGPSGYHYIPFDTDRPPIAWPVSDTPVFACICQFSDDTFNYGYGCIVQRDRNTRHCDYWAFSECYQDGGYCPGIMHNNATTLPNVIIYARYGVVLVKADAIIIP